MPDTTPTAPESAPRCVWPDCLTEPQHAELQAQVTAEEKGQPGSPMPDQRQTCGCTEATTPAPVRVAIDPNVRVAGNLGRAGLEDADGPLTVGQDVTVYEPESGLTGPGRVERIDTDKQLVFLAVQWDALRSAPGPHACGNCEGIDPASCLNNPDRPRGGQPAPAPVDPALRDRVAEAIRNALKTRTLPPITDFTGRPLDGTGFGLTEYDLAEVALAELAPELGLLAAGIPLICTDERHQAKVTALEAQVRRLGDLIDRLGPTEQKHRDDLATARAKALTQPTAPEATP